MGNALRKWEEEYVSQSAIELVMYFTTRNHNFQESKLISDTRVVIGNIAINVYKISQKLYSKVK